MNDPRIAELEELAQEEQIDLPYPAHVIVGFEDRGFVVDLVTGMVYKSVTVQPTRISRAINHLLSPCTIPA